MENKTGPLPWREIKKRISGKNQKELLTMIGKCYRASPDVRIVLSMSVSEGRNENKIIISDLKERLNAIFWTTSKNGCPKTPNLREAGKIITLAKNSTTNPAILVDIILDHLEHGVGFTMEYGDMWESYYTSIENQFERTCKFIVAHQSEIDMDRALDRIDKQIEETRNIGWGFEETLDAFREDLMEKLEK